MANTKSAQKAWRQAQKRAIHNQAARSAVRTYVKKATEAVATSVEDAAVVVRAAVRALDRAAQRGIVHRNAAARRKSRLMARLHQLSLGPSEAVEAAPAAGKGKSGSKAPAKRTAGAKGQPAARKPATTSASKPASRKPGARV